MLNVRGMRFFVGFILIAVLASCETESITDVKKSLEIYGHAINYGHLDSAPLSNAKVKISYKTYPSGVIEFDSTVTDMNGDFVFERNGRDAEVYEYLMKVHDDYLEVYEPGLWKPMPEGFNVKYVNDEKIHYDTIVVNETCNVKLIFKETTPDEHNRNFVTSETEVTIANDPINIHHGGNTFSSSGEINDKYFPDNVVSVKYHIQIVYNSSGEVIYSSKVVSMVPRHTEEVLIEY